MTHADLVALACRWLKGRKRCAVVFAEFSNVTSEEPDAIGWMSGAFSHLVECKTSRSDFRRDLRKAGRGSGAGMGHWRWYLAPSGLLKPAELPDGWGLLETGGRRVNVRAEAEPQPSSRDLQEELCILRSAVIRHQSGVGWRPDRFRFDPYRDE